MLFMKEETNNTEIEVVNDLPSIVDLPTKQQRFIHLYTTGHFTLAKLGELLDVHPNTLGNWLRKPEVKAVINDLQLSTHEAVSSQLKFMSNAAATKLLSLLDSPIDGVALQAVKDVLDRAGHKPEQKIKVDKTVVTYEEKLQNLISDVIDVTDYESIEVDEDEE